MKAPPLLISFLVPLFAIPMASAEPTAIPDNYEGLEDSVLSVDALEGVLANDSANTTAALETDVANGSLALNADGSFTYRPDENFNGSDSFTYRAEEFPSTLTFTVDRSRSQVDLSATINAIISQTRSDDSSVTGTLEVQLSPPGTPFDGVHIQMADLVLADDVSLSYGLLFVFSAEVSANGGDIALSLTEPGPPASADPTGAFTQPMNDLAIAGMMDVQTSGIDLGVPDGAVDIGSTLDDIDFDGVLTQSGGTITLTLPEIAFDGTFPIGDNSVDISITGTLVATAPVPSVQQSEPATVTIEVDPINDAPLAFSEPYFVFDGESLIAPAGAGGAGEALVAGGSDWRYLDAGSDAGTEWREAGFDDASWAIGAAELGYGDDDEATVVGFGGDENNKHLTTYFRQSFDVAHLEASSGLRLRLLRDDGAAVYLNGVEILRDNLPVGASFDTAATMGVSGDAETVFLELDLSPAALVEGANVLAVEVHQAAADSSDLSFDLELLRLPVSGLLANDSDIDGDTLGATLAVPPANGVAVVAVDGSFEYTPNPGFSGADPFVYAVSDSGGTMEVELIPSGAGWRYLDDGSDQGIAWRANAFDDSSWGLGDAQLGYGESDEATVVGFGGDTNNKHVTTYFRHGFYVGDPDALASLVFRLLRDDAAAIYLNGAEVFRDGTLASGAAFDTLATAAINETLSEIAIAIPTANLIAGTNVIAVEVHQSSLGSSDLSFALSAEASLPAPSVVMPRGGEWAYLDDGSDQGIEWRANGFDDSGWESGAAPLGYGGDEVTSVGFGGDPGSKFATTYFRREFEVIGAAEAVAALLRLRRDDGAAVYVNGVEIARANLDAGATSADFATATTASSDEFHVIGFDPSLLNEGTNVIAAEVHQASADSSDIIFDAELAISVDQILRVARVNVVSPSAADADTDGDGIPDSYETANGLDVGVDDSAGDLDGDGQSNIAEFVAGTLANDPSSVLRVTAIAPVAEALEITVATVPGKTYQLQSSTAGIVWSDVGSMWTATSGSETIGVTRDGDGGLWRVRVVEL